VKEEKGRIAKRTPKLLSFYPALREGGRVRKKKKRRHPKRNERKKGKDKIRNLIHFTYLVMGGDRGRER